MRGPAVALGVALVMAACGDAVNAPGPAAETSRPATAAGAPASSAASAASAGPILMNTVTAADETTLSVTSPRSRREPALARARTVPLADCTITVTYPSGQSGAEGLEPKTADGAGDIAWSWRIEPSVPAGSWPVEVTCGTVSGLRAVARQSIVVP